jgi:anti-anti-sigma factor
MRVVRLQGCLRVPISRVLRRQVRVLLLRGERRIVVDLTEIPAIDAAGIGELVKVFNMSAAADGQLRIVNATRWVRQILEFVGLFELLSGRARPGDRPRRSGVAA